MTIPPSDVPTLDVTTYVRQTAALLGLNLPAAIEAGVIANFEHIQAIAQPLIALDLPATLESATTFEP